MQPTRRQRPPTSLPGLVLPASGCPGPTGTLGHPDGLPSSPEPSKAWPSVGVRSGRWSLCLQEDTLVTIQGWCSGAQSHLGVAVYALGDPGLPTRWAVLTTRLESWQAQGIWAAWQSPQSPGQAHSSAYVGVRHVSCLLGIWNRPAGHGSDAWQITTSHVWWCTPRRPSLLGG